MQSTVLNPVPKRTSAPSAKRPTTLAEFAQSTPDLPDVPTVALAAHRETGRLGATASSVANLVENDSALTARVLRLANSAYCGNACQVSAIADAVAILGMKSVRNLCLLAGAYPWLKGGLPAYGLGPDALMTHSLAAAIASRAVAEHAGLDADAAFTAGLLHDMGKIALSLWAPGADDEVRCPQDERRLLGFDHGAVGGELARVWNLPEALVDAIARHHEPRGGLEDAVHVGDTLAHLMMGEPSLSLDSSTLARLNLTAESMLGMIERLRLDLADHLELLEACA